MTKDEQKEFATQLCASIKDKILDDITAGRVPENWDGHELRALIALRAKAAVYRMDAGHRRAFNGTVLINNL